MLSVPPGSTLQRQKVIKAIHLTPQLGPSKPARVYTAGEVDPYLSTQKPDNDIQLASLDQSRLNLGVARVKHRDTLVGVARQALPSLRLRSQVYQLPRVSYDCHRFSSPFDQYGECFTFYGLLLPFIGENSPIHTHVECWGSGVSGRARFEARGRQTGLRVAKTRCPPCMTYPGALTLLCYGAHAEMAEIPISFSGHTMKRDHCDVVTFRALPIENLPSKRSHGLH